MKRNGQQRELPERVASKQTASPRHRCSLVLSPKLFEVVGLTPPRECAQLAAPGCGLCPGTCPSTSCMHFWYRLLLRVGPGPCTGGTPARRFMEVTPKSFQTGGILPEPGVKGGGEAQHDGGGWMGPGGWGQICGHWPEDNMCAEGERKQARPSPEALKGLTEAAAGAWGFDLALPAPHRVRSGWPQPYPTVMCDSLTPAST